MRRLRSSRSQACAAVTLQLLLLLLAAATGDAGAARQLHGDVPGQAFHDWRTALLAARFPTGVNASDARDLALSLAVPGWRAQRAQRWLSIVGHRERISELAGPPQRIASHPAAAQRLQVAQLLLTQAAATHAAAQQDTGSPSKQQQEKGVPPEVSEPWMLKPSSDSPAAKTTVAATAAATAADAALLHKLTGLMQRQPYPPLSTRPADLESTLMSFVQRGPGGRLVVDGKPWLLKGINLPEALQLAGGSPQQRHQLLYLLDRAQTLGLNALRIRAFADGSAGVKSASGQAAWQQFAAAPPELHLALQPAPGVLNGTMFRDGLDWLVHEAGLRGLRLLLVLTNGGSSQGGGMKQYVDWVDPALTVTAFYTNDTIKSVFLDYVAGLLDHTSSLSGLPLREDPVILGWQLAEDASHPGQPASQELLAWLKQMGVFIKQRAPHQLLLPGVLDLFGRNSPHHLALNPPAQMSVFAPSSHSPHAYAPLCHGTDFWLNHQLPEVDVATVGVFPDAALACSPSCKLDWARAWIRGHLRDALKLNKPLLLGGVGALRPQGWRRQVVQLVRQEVERALQKGHPIAGFLLSGLSHPRMPDASGAAVYLAASGVHAAAPPLASLNAQAVADVKWRRFMNYNALLGCTAHQARGSSNEKGQATNTQAWVDGWEDVVRAVAGLARLPNELPAGSSLAA